MRCASILEGERTTFLTFAAVSSTMCESGVVSEQEHTREDLEHMVSQLREEVARLKEEIRRIRRENHEVPPHYL